MEHSKIPLRIVQLSFGGSPDTISHVVISKMATLNDLATKNSSHFAVGEGGVGHFISVFKEIRRRFAARCLL